jgi:predicted transcriptional regulator
MHCNALYYLKVNAMGMTSVRMPDELLDRLEQTAEKLQRSKGWIIKDAVKEYLAREELKQERNQETLEAWEDYKAGRVVDGDEVIAWLDSWGAEDEKEPPVK